jgi:transposase
MEIKGHYYSVPYSLVGEEVEIRLTATTVECFHKGTRIASHPRSFQVGGQTTCGDHLPLGHRRYLEGTPSRVRQEAHQIGVACSGVIEAIFQRGSHPEQGLRSSLGILRLVKSYGKDRLESACSQAIRLRGYSYTQIASILKYGLDQRVPAGDTPSLPPVEHSNIRGAAYYQTEQQTKEEDLC